MKRALKVLKTIATRRLVLSFDKVELVHTGLSNKRLLNWLLAEMSYVFRSKKAWAYPTHLQIEPSNTCNLRCPVCHVVTDNKPQGILRFEDFKQIMDEVGDYTLLLHFWGWGEPFMNPDLFRMARYASDKGIKIISSTNGHFFDIEDNHDKLIDSGLDALIIALDGTDRETYEKYRHKGDFDKVLRGMRSFIRRRSERGAERPVINLRMLVTSENEHQVPAMRALAEEVGADILTLKTLNVFDNEEEGKRLVPKDPGYQRFHYDDDGNPIRIDNSCRKLWNHPTIYRDGAVVLCDYHTGEELTIGNAFSHNGAFHDIWFGKEYRKLRARFVDKDRSGLRCDNCVLNFADVDRCVSHAFQVKEKSVS